MMNVTLPNGTVINNVPDGTSKSDVARMAIKNGLAKPSDFPGLGLPESDGWAKTLTSKPDPNGGWAAFGKSAILDMSEAGDRLRHWLGGSDTADETRQMKEARHRTQEAAGLHPTAAKAGEIAGTLAPMLAGWGAGEALAPEIAGTGIWSRGANLLAKGAAGSVGSQLAEGESPTAGQTAEDAAVNAAVVTMLGAPGKAMTMVKNLIGRPDAQIMQDAATLGVKPSLSTVTGSKAIRVAEDMLTKLPGGAGEIEGAHADEFKAIDRFIGEMADGTGRTGDSTQLGEEIKRGLTRFTQDFTDKSEKLYDQLWQEIPKGQRIKTDNFQGALEAIANRWQRDPQLNSILGNKTVNELLQAITERPIDPEKADIIYQVTGEAAPKAEKAQPLTVDSVKALRSRIGASLDDPALLSRDLEESDRNQLYEALTKDIEQAANQNGDKAARAWKRANGYWRAGRTRIDDYLNPIFRANTGDNIYRNIFGATNKKLTALSPQRAMVLMRSLPDEVAAKVRGEVIARLGESSSAKGGKFSPDTFVTNWGALPERSKRALFADAITREQIDTLGRYSSALKDLGRVRNFSNTASHVVLGSMVYHALVSPITGIPSLAGVVGGSKITAKLMNNPKFIEWLASTSGSATDTELKRNVARLVAIYFAHPDLQGDISDYAHSFPETP
jgi:hypothetical protein